MVLQDKFSDAQAFLAREGSEFWPDYSTALVAWRSGDRAEADAALSRLMALAEIAAYQIAEVYAYRAEPDQAFSWLERAYRRRDAGISQISSSPFLTRLVDDPRYTAFLEKVGLPNPYAR
jgi:hypothetical protein